MMNGDFRRNPTAQDGGFLTLETPPAVAIISTADARAHCRVESSDDDAELDGFVAACNDHIDADNGILGRALITQTWRLSLNSAPQYRKLNLPFPPVQSVTEIRYFDTNGDEQVFASSNYRLIAAGDAPFVELASGASWPSVQDRSAAFWVVFVVGYGDAATDIPESLIVAAKMMLGSLYEQREATQEGAVSTVPMGFDALCDKFKVARF